MTKIVIFAINKTTMTNSDRSCRYAIKIIQIMPYLVCKFSNPDMCSGIPAGQIGSKLSPLPHGLTLSDKTCQLTPFRKNCKLSLYKVVSHPRFRSEK